MTRRATLCNWLESTLYYRHRKKLILDVWLSCSLWVWRLPRLVKMIPLTQASSQILETADHRHKPSEPKRKSLKTRPNLIRRNLSKAFWQTSLSHKSFSKLTKNLRKQKLLQRKVHLLQGPQEEFRAVPEVASQALLLRKLAELSKQLYYLMKISIG